MFERKKFTLILVFALMLTTFGISRAESPQKWHVLESYCVSYKLEGMMTGTKKICSKNFGRLFVEIRKSEMKLPGTGIVKKENVRVITKISDEGQVIITINQDDNTGTIMKNPMFEKMMQSMRGKDPKEFGEGMMKSMGAKIVGNKVVAGEKCEIWEIGGLSETCVTEDGLTLEVISKMANINEVATEVKRNDSGPKSLYEIGDAKLKEIDMGAMMQR